MCLQDGGFSAYRRDHVPSYQADGDDPYIRGYSHGLQRAWLEAELAAARREPGIDWIVVCMHQVAMSSAHFNGADLGIRQQILPLFDRYGVDLVVAGHEHHFERTFPVRGILPGSTLLTPAPQGSNPAEIDTRDGYVHMIIGGGGHSTPTPLSDFDLPHDGVLIVEVGPGNPQSQHASITTTEPAPWSAYRDLADAVRLRLVRRRARRAWRHDLHHGHPLRGQGRVERVLPARQLRHAQARAFRPRGRAPGARAELTGPSNMVAV